MKSTSEIIAENPRIMWAVLGSMLLHASVVMPWFAARQKAPPATIETFGFTASLVARMAGAQDAEQPGDLAPVPQPSVAPAPPPVVERPAREFVAPVQERAAAESRAAAVSPGAGEADGGADGFRGVSVKETLFQRHFPPAFQKALSEFPGYFPALQISRPPQPVNIVMPRYPAKEQAARTYTWIVVALLIDETGRVVEVLPVTGGEGHEGFQDQVAATLRESTFTAGERFGLPVRTMLFQMVEFRPQ